MQRLSLSHRMPDRARLDLEPAHTIRCWVWVWVWVWGWRSAWQSDAMMASADGR